jgi:23S rRNA (adenine2503-C2)-methyltransferase
MEALLELHPRQWPEFFKSLGVPAFHGKSAAQWVFRKGASEWKEMTDLPAALRQQLQNDFPLCKSEVLKTSRAEDGAVKILLRFPGGSTTEAVGMPGTQGRTLCLSTQVGCPVRCVFCASGIDGLERNLSRAEILEQVIQLRKVQGDFHRIVVMGMGDVGFNLEEVLGALDALLDKEGAGMAARRITISTVAPRGTLPALAKWGKPVSLALSLHAPTDELRHELVPGVAKRSIAETLDEAKALFESTGREYTVEYVLLQGVNDSLQQATQLAHLLRGHRCHINLIPYNEVEEMGWERPSRPAQEAFAEVLRQNGRSVTLRRSLGRSQDAACGQLRRRQIVT